jgi:heptosyltransferase I
LNRLEPNSKVLFIRASAVGDVLNTLPAVEALRAAYPGLFIGYLVDERSRDLVEGHPALNRIHFFPRKRWIALFKNPLQWKTLASEVRIFVKDLKSERYDLSVDLQRNLKGGILGLLARAQLRVGLARPIAKEGNQFLTHVQVKPPDDAIHFTEHFLAVARHLGAEAGAPLFRFPDSPESVYRVGEFLEGKGLSRYAVIHPGTSAFGKLKRWPPDRFALLARRMGEELGLKSVIAWGPGEGPLAQVIAEESGGQAVLSLETKSLLDLVELIRRSALFVGCDSGPMHIAGAVDAPCVALFGPKDPALYGPYRPAHCRIVQPPGGTGPTEGITVESVSEAVASILKETGKNPRRPNPNREGE